MQAHPSNCQAACMEDSNGQPRETQAKMLAKKVEAQVWLHQWQQEWEKMRALECRLFRLANTEENDHTGTKDNGSNDNGVVEEDRVRWHWASSSEDSHSSSSVGSIETPSCESRKHSQVLWNSSSNSFVVLLKRAERGHYCEAVIKDLVVLRS